MLQVLIISSLISVCFGQNVLSNIKLSLREEKIPDVLTHVLNNSLETFEISTRDIIQLSKLDQIDENGLEIVLNYYNVTEVYTVNNLEKVLTTLNIAFTDAYRSITSELNLDVTKQQDILNILKIPVEFWMVIAVGKNEEIYDILRKGTYDKAATDAAFISSGYSAHQVFQAIQDLLAENVATRSTQNFINLLQSLGWNRKSAQHFYNAVNLTTQDIYNVDKFKTVFTNISDGLNKYTTFGVFIAENKIALHKDVYKNLQELVDVSYVKIEAGSNEIIFKNNNDLGKHIIEMTTLTPTSDYIEIVKSYNSSENCTYSFFTGGSVTSFDVKVTNFTITKTPDLIFFLGAPLICDEQLYALASSENEEKIFFDTFYTEDMPKPPITSSANSFSEYFAVFSIVLCNLFIYLILT